VALGLWLTNRLADGLDGPTARAGVATDAGGFLDIVADFSIYAGVILGLAIALPTTRLACVALLTAYYISGTAFLALSSLAERRRQRLGDDRSLRFVGGLAEGTETIAVYILLFLLPQHATVIVWAFAGAVAITAVQRVVTGVRLLRTAAPGGPAAVPAAAVAGGSAILPVPLPAPKPRPHEGRK
jgi:phosphatidylglycerophosphate synthase